MIGPSDWHNQSVTEGHAHEADHTLAPCWTPASGLARCLPIRKQASSESIKPILPNHSTPRSPASTKPNRTDLRPSPRKSLNHKDRPLSPTDPRPKKKPTKSRFRLKKNIVIFRKKSTFQVSCPREPLENYDISSATVTTSSSVKKEQTSSTTKG